MTEVTFRQIKNAIASLTMSTDVTLINFQTNTACQLLSRNKQRVAHKTVSYRNAHEDCFYGFDGGIQLKNDKYSVILHPVNLEDDTLCISIGGRMCEWHIDQVPSELVAPLFSLANTYFNISFPKSTSLVYIAIAMPILLKFDHDGRPIFLEAPRKGEEILNIEL